MDLRILFRTSCFTVTLMVAGSCTGQDEKLPRVNRCVVDFVVAQDGKKVGRGECWDLAAEALNGCNAKWNGFYDFGKNIEWKRYEVLAGDIVQFENVEVERREGDMVSRERYGQHTAVIVEVHARGDYTIAHQNMQPFGKKVGKGRLRMADVRSGKLTFYRPQE